VVPQQSAYVVERLGKYAATFDAGFHILFPFVDTIRYRHSLKETAVDIPAQVCITATARPAPRKLVAEDKTKETTSSTCCTP